MRFIRYIGFAALAAFGVAFGVNSAVDALLGVNATGQRDALMPAYLELVSKVQAQGFTLPNGTVANGHLNVAGSPPVVSSCGSGPTVTAGSTDLAGSVTVKQSSCVITFAATYTNAPWCIVRDQTTSSTGFAYSVSATAITISGGLTSNDVVNYICLGRPN